MLALIYTHTILLSLLIYKPLSDALADIYTSYSSLSTYISSRFRMLSLIYTLPILLELLIIAAFGFSR